MPSDGEKAASTLGVIPINSIITAIHHVTRFAILFLIFPSFSLFLALKPFHDSGRHGIHSSVQRETRLAKFSNARIGTTGLLLEAPLNSQEWQLILSFIPFTLADFLNLVFHEATVFPDLLMDLVAPGRFIISLRNFMHDISPVF